MVGSTDADCCCRLTPAAAAVAAVLQPWPPVPPGTLACGLPSSVHYSRRQSSRRRPCSPCMPLTSPRPAVLLSGRNTHTCRHQQQRVVLPVLLVLLASLLL